MELIIQPHVGIGPVRLGMKRDTVRTILGGLGGGNPVARSADIDCFFRNSLQVSFEPDETASFIEVASDAEWICLFEGTDVFDTPADDLLRHIERFDSPDPLLSMKNDYVFSSLILTLWEADSQYDCKRGETRGIFGAVGIGDDRYLAAIRALAARRH